MLISIAISNNSNSAFLAISGCITFQVLFRSNVAIAPDPKIFQIVQKIVIQ